MNVIILLAAIGQFPSFQPAVAFPSFQVAATVTPVEPQYQLISFTSTWCGPCQRMKPVLSEIEAQGVTVYRVDYDCYRTLSNQWKVTTLPTTIVVDGNVEIERRVGVIEIGVLRRMVRFRPRAAEFKYETHVLAEDRNGVPVYVPIEPARPGHTHAELGGAVCRVCGQSCYMLRAAEAAARAKGETSNAAIQAEYTKQWGSGGGYSGRSRLFSRRR